MIPLYLNIERGSSKIEILEQPQNRKLVFFLKIVYPLAKYYNYAFSTELFISLVSLNMLFVHSFM